MSCISFTSRSVLGHWSKLSLSPLPRVCLLVHSFACQNGSALYQCKPSVRIQVYPSIDLDLFVYQEQTMLHQDPSFQISWIETSWCHAIGLHRCLLVEYHLHKAPG